VNKPFNPLELDTSAGESVAFVSSDREGVSHWTELEILYLPSADGRCYFAEARGCTRREGQTTRRRAVYVGTIGRALDFYDNGDLKDGLTIAAKDWLDRNAGRAEADIRKLREAEAGDQPPAVSGAAPAGFLGQGGLKGALRWLYEDQRERVVDVRDSNLVDAFAEDFGVPARTVRHSLKQERDGGDLPSWCKAFIASLMHFDREAFRAAKGGA
jgi:hypothetical protein